MNTAGQVSEPLWLQARRLRFELVDLPKPMTENLDAYCDWIDRVYDLLSLVDDQR